MNKKSGDQFKERILALAIGCIAFSGLLVFRLYQLQIDEHTQHQERSQRQATKIISIPAKRGDILDRNGEYLAKSTVVPSIYADPSLIDDPRPHAGALASILEESAESIYHKLSRANTQFVWLKRHVSGGSASEILNIGHRGLGVTYEPRRYYVAKTLAAHILGYTNIDGKGLEGIELAFEDELGGKRLKIRAMRDGGGSSVLTEQLDPHELSLGNRVYLTLDTQIQNEVEESLKEVVKKHRALSASAILLDVETSEVLAMGIYPTFNPNNGRLAKADHRRNRAVTDAFEPGSTVKPFVIAQALELGNIQPNTEIFCEKGQMKIGKYTIHDTKPYDWLNIEAIIQKSSNICTAKIGERLGQENLYNLFDSIGFGRKTGIELPSETRGLLNGKGKWSTAKVATISYGHGVSVSLLQLAAAYRTIASGGLYQKPTLLKRVELPSGKTNPRVNRSEKRVFSSEIASVVNRMMESVVKPGGTGLEAAIDGIRVAGKTGTTKKLRDDGKGYSSTDYIASFAGFAPADAPRFVAVVMVDEPRDQYYGGSVAGPVFSRIMSFALEHDKRENLVASHPFRPSRELVVQSALQRLKTSSQEGDVPKDSRDGLDRNTGMPSLYGKTARESLIVLSRLSTDIDIHIEGTGLVYEQSPKPGVSLGRVKKLSLRLRQGE
ncbi:MAG: penicillin-binding protein [Myxococcota bacterium]|nr:penicillin-binding protein [Myxococcota bacterium]